MSILRVKGNEKLKGEVNVSGSKNAALPIIFSTLVIEGVSVIKNVPNISDVEVALKLIAQQGAVVIRGKNSVTIDTRQVKYSPPASEISSQIRASTYLMGACLARFGVAGISEFGGCNFSKRPIDMHLYAATRLGATVGEGKLSATQLLGNDIYFDKISVGATVNAIIMASRAKGVSRIFNPAIEPHVTSLIAFLRKAGIKIETRASMIAVHGGAPVSATVKIIPDMIEAGTYIALSLLTDSDLKICGINRSHLASFIYPLVEAGAIFEFERDSVRVKGRISDKIKVETAPYPGFPTDLQPIFAPLMLKFNGGEIVDTVWRERFGYLNELKKIGAKFTRAENKAILEKSNLHSGKATAPDLRGGASLLLSALSTEGESIIENAEIISRGYENLSEKLSKIGFFAEFAK